MLALDSAIVWISKTNVKYRIFVLKWIWTE